jgi:hypothetical protein
MVSGVFVMPALMAGVFMALSGWVMVVVFHDKCCNEVTDLGEL